MVVLFLCLDLDEFFLVEDGLCTSLVVLDKLVVTLTFGNFL